jgi:hypothetical protein
MVSTYTRLAKLVPYLLRLPLQKQPHSRSTTGTAGTYTKHDGRLNPYGWELRENCRINMSRDRADMVR